MTHKLFIGLMSGTSVDAIDSALVGCREDGVSLLETREHPIPATMRERIRAISHCGEQEIERMGILDRELGQLFAQATQALLEQANVPARDIVAIGSHGQTIRHRPPSATPAKVPAFTLQIADPNTIAEITGITTVADFRRRDIAAGGEGAPLAPAFHAAAFTDAACNRAIVNIGGIANATLLQGDKLLEGFDTGPGNTLLDLWIGRHSGEACDRSGRWAAAGTVQSDLLEALLQHEFLALSGPRSTGKEAFNMEWLDQQLAAFPGTQPIDVQATLAQFTAATIALAIDSSGLAVQEIYVCGGGAHNNDLMQRLQTRLAPASVATTAALGMDPDWVEAVTFAWLAQRTLDGLYGNAPAVTGASGERVLGAIYPGDSRSL